MAASNINRVTITGNLTRDPELRNIPNSGNSVCELRVAVNTRRKNSSGEWEDYANYFDVTVWGGQGENCATYLQKGRPVAVDGRLQWREWEDKETGKKRQAISIVADTVQFLGSREGGGGNGNGLHERLPGNLGQLRGRRHPVLAALGEPPTAGRSLHSPTS
jgi:single-strand DNA-binding protein